MSAELPSEVRSNDGLGAAQCWCHECNKQMAWPFALKMIVCPDCGNKRCPHASDHRHACTGSNAPGQPGSVYTVEPGRIFSEAEIRAAIEALRATRVQGA